MWGQPRSSTHGPYQTGGWLGRCDPSGRGSLRVCVCVFVRVCVCVCMYVQETERLTHGHPETPTPTHTRIHTPTPVLSGLHSGTSTDGWGTAQAPGVQAVPMRVGG